MLGRLADQPCQRDEREGGQHEQRDVAHARVVEHDDERSQRQESEEDLANHGAGTLTFGLRCSTPFSSTGATRSFGSPTTRRSSRRAGRQASEHSGATSCPASGPGAPAGTIMSYCNQLQCGPTGQNVLQFHPTQVSTLNALIAAESVKPEWFILDVETIPLLDITGAEVVDEFRGELAEQGVVLAIARASGFFRMMLERSGVAGRLGEEHLFPTVRAATDAFLASTEDKAQSKAS